jgi:hypothetical protein
MDEIIMQAATELGIRPNVSVKPFDGADPEVMVGFPPRRPVQGRIPVQYLMEESQEQLKILLTEMAKRARQN